MASTRNILIIEDNEINRIMLRGILCDQYNVLEAENGQQALDMLLACKEPISLILLDLIMPVMDGYTFLSHVKADTVLSAIPVIVTTQSDGESSEVTALSHGAADFVAKPYKPQVILHRVANIINLRETAALINQIQYDRLTGLYSKNFFCQLLHRYLEQNPGKKYDIICSDIENFKLVNDVFGTHIGDLMLVRLAEAYKATPAVNGLRGRLGADQLCIVVERRDDYADFPFPTMEPATDELRNVKNIVLKFGIYPITDLSVSTEQMCDRALLAARSIKGQYGKSVAMYDDTMRNKLLMEQEITNSMVSALNEEQFVVYIQPKYRLKDGGLLGAEALVRWQHPVRGLLPPVTFIPLFEENGFITKLDQYVWEKTCALLHEIDLAGLPVCPISVNVSRADIYNVELLPILTGLVKKYKLPTELLHLEITESAYTEDPQQIIDAVAKLRGAGFMIEMDDFGSGYSSLNMLNQMPLDILKLDSKFIQDEVGKPQNQGLLRFVVGLAHWMELLTVAEGVETKEQAIYLQSIGCDSVQGYYFAKPMPAQEYVALLTASKHNISTFAQCAQEVVLPKAEQSNALMLVLSGSAEYREAALDAFGNEYTLLQTDNPAAALTHVISYGPRIAVALFDLYDDDAEGNASLFNLIRQQRTVWKVPIIAIGPANPDLELAVLNAGADDYAIRPHTMAAMRLRVEHVLRLRAAAKRANVMAEEADRDYLTGLLNRRGLNRALAALRPEDGSLGVCLFDLDNLKVVNDTMGHTQGDVLLQQFAGTLRRNTRSNDILARYGGDELLLIICNSPEEDVFVKKCKDLCDAIHAASSETLCASCSAGAVLCDAREPLSQMIRKADQALYQAKMAGKGVCALYKAQQ